MKYVDEIEKLIEALVGAAVQRATDPYYIEGTAAIAQEAVQKALVALARKAEVGDEVENLKPNRFIHRDSTGQFICGESWKARQSFGMTAREALGLENQEVKS